ncbi:MAG: hypothetical protein JWN21_994 [Sphingomonas bacterium]|uniref:hypothetical protein n=1 Tax=Sphingomonas bacterium TaxID=1895847 RepID=UPI002603E32D|nr:hypothetical protein [Sphingomonas bacterium]MDB5695451.1 hypothetical protein [Sphingomonas bacterium]
MSTRDRVGQLLRALRRSAAEAGCTVAVSHSTTTAWASATFVGAQHRVFVRGNAWTWLADLPAAELPLHGCFVASCDVESAIGGAVLTMLILEE